MGKNYKCYQISMLKIIKEVKKMKKILIIAILFFLQAMAFGNWYANKILPKEYYEIKRQLWIEDDNSYAAIRFSKEKDLEIIISLFEILKNYKPDTQEIIDERRFIESAFITLMPITEYKDYNEATLDDFQQISKQKRKYYLIIKEWEKEKAINYYIKRGYPKEISEEMINAIWTIRKKSSYEQGKRMFKKLFDNKVYDINFLYAYFSFINEEDKEKNILQFYESHFDHVTEKQLNDRELGTVLKILMKYCRKKQKEKELLNKFFNKMNVGGSYSEIINSSDQTKDTILEIICNEDIIMDINLRKKVIEFLRKNKEIIDNREKGYWLKERTKKFLIENKDKIGFKTDIKDIISIEK